MNSNPEIEPVPSLQGACEEAAIVLCFFGDLMIVGSIIGELSARITHPAGALGELIGLGFVVTGATLEQARHYLSELVSEGQIVGAREDDLDSPVGTFTG